jgi:hypothetical protein
MDPTYAQAIKDIESSGGNYSSLGPATDSGDRAYGAYQVMGNNIPDWTEKHYGTRLTPQQFLQNKEAQDAVFNGEFGSYVKQYGNPQDAASMWFSGKPMAQAGNASDGSLTVPQYVQKFNNGLQKHGNGVGAINAAAGINPAGGPGSLTSAFASPDNQDDGEDSPSPTPGMLSANNTMGPGALTPQRLMNGDNSTDKMDILTQGGMGIAASLAGISSPGQAYALNQQLQQMKNDSKSKYKISVGKDGRIIRVDDSGNVDVVGGNPAGTNPDGSPAMLGDPTKQGDEYLKTLQPVDAQIVPGMIDGTVPAPSAYAMKSPRIQQLIAAARQVDPEFDANKWSARNTMAKDLAKSNPASLGGILANGQSAFRHLGLASDGFVGVGNSNGYDGPGGNLVAQGVNALKNYGGSSALADKLTAANEEISKYGTESTKYYAGSPGGVHERAAAQKATDPWSASGAAQAGYVDASKNLMVERGKELEAHIRDTMGQRYLDKHPVFSKDTQALMDRIDKNVSKLRGSDKTSSASKDRPSLNSLIPLNQ